MNQESSKNMEASVQSKIDDVDVLPASSDTSPVSRLLRVLEERRGEEHLVIIQGAPDPDAISSAMALQLIAEQYEISTTMLCFAGVSHHENRALVKKLGINLVRYNPDFDLSPFGSYSLVDSQQTGTKIDTRLEEQQMPLLAFVDHHREDVVTPSALHVDIRPHVSSTAAIFCEYLQAVFSGGLSPSDPAHVRLATALMHGIRSDTSRFRTASQLDYQGASFLAPCVDEKAIELIERKLLSPAMLEMFETAMVNRRVHDNFLFADVGYLRESDRDGLPQVAEFLLAREGTDTVLVFGIVDEKTIDGSLRTTSETINPDEFLKGVLGVSEESGRYYGGGNIKDKGGFQVPLGFFGLYEDKELVYRMAREIIERSFLNYIGKAEKGTKKKSTKSGSKEREEIENREA